MDGYIVFDLEATCCDDHSFPREEMETIEIGAVKLDQDYNVVDEFDRFVQPFVHPKLTRFCTKLTHIRQDDVDDASSFPLVMYEFLKWTEPGKYWLCSWGDYDIKQLERDCQRFSLALPTWMIRWHRNIKQQFADRLEVRPCGLGKAVARTVGAFQGTQHRGIDDARNIASVMRQLQLG